MLGGSDNYRLYAARLRAWSICFGVVAGRAWAAVVPGAGCVSGLEPSRFGARNQAVPVVGAAAPPTNSPNESPQTAAKTLAAMPLLGCRSIGVATTTVGVLKLVFIPL